MSDLEIQSAEECSPVEPVPGLPCHSILICQRCGRCLLHCVCANEKAQGGNQGPSVAENDATLSSG